MKTRCTLLFPVFIICITVTINAEAQVNVQDSLALVDLYNSTNGSSWYNHQNWLTNKPVKSWYGITVSKNRVGSILLDDNNLTGLLPSSLGNLSDLIYLYLEYNHLKGNIPSALGNLANLIELYLFNNKLSGSIPPELGNLSRLISLSLENNQLSGGIPPELGNLSSLTGLSLYNNQLSGSIPPELGNLSNLSNNLELENNQLSGSIPPELGNLSHLAALHLYNNQLSGSIPPELGRLSHLGSLFLSGNQLSGNIPPELGNLSHLGDLELDHNQLSGSIPPELGNLSGLYSSFNLSFNQLSGDIAPELGSLTKLYSIELNDNQLTGSIPSELGNDYYLGYLDLSGNQLNDSIPPALGNLTNLTYLNLSYNKLTGSIPRQLNNIKVLMKLKLSHNQLSGDIPSLANLHLDSLDLSHNHFTFDGLEAIAQRFTNARYNNQAILTPHIKGNTISVSAGGTLSNNTYTWYKAAGLKTKITGDSVFHPAESGVYIVRVQNKIANHLNLFSDTISYVAPVALNAIAAGSEQKASNNGFTVYPNPAKNILNIQTNSSASFSLIDISGKVLLTKNIDNTGSINVSGMPGLYYVKNNNTNAVQKVIIER